MTAIGKDELRKGVVPFVKRFLIEECGATFYAGKQRDQVGHAIYTHATSTDQPDRYPATILYETSSWAWEFVDWMDDAGYADDYEFEALSSYEISVRRLYAPAPSTLKAYRGTDSIGRRKRGTASAQEWVCFICLEINADKRRTCQRCKYKSGTLDR